MNNWREDYIRGFIAIIGIALLLIGFTINKISGGSAIGLVFIIIGIIIVSAVLFWWYKKFQRGE